ncbi:MAG TPA: hypothetical protein VFN25_14350 [Dokdonella sp.]|uniref:hypothetical protein n=1 Tax=Dokdonella sp. TaxID=2291710 RepID=UPI002D7F5A5E|nr:hypothetical protein [Dokdonella sp.]HET9034071.1 hypothetical protein [Dokdonella sp.]
MNPFPRVQNHQQPSRLSWLLLLMSPLLQASNLYVCDCAENSLPACVAGNDGNSGDS